MRKQRIKCGVMKEFKEFISKGNVMNLAVGVIIGGAFQKIVTSLVDDIIMPVIGVMSKGIDFSKWGYDFKNPLNSDEVLVTIMYGKFISVVLNFLIMAFIVFWLVKLVNKVMSIRKKEEPKAETTKQCPYCKSMIDIGAVRCPKCTSMLEEEAEKDGD